jgi:hypothetical protein
LGFAPQGTKVRMTLRNDMNEVFELDLLRGTPEYFDSLQVSPSLNPKP